MKKMVIMSVFLLVFGLVGSAGAYTFSSGDLGPYIVTWTEPDGKEPWASFEADFTNNELTVILDELGIVAANNGDVLTAVFWYSDITFTPKNASETGSWIGTATAAIGSEWDYDTTLAAGVGYGANQGIGSVGDPGFDHGNFVVSPQNPVNGVSYGIVNGGFGGTQTPVLDGYITFLLGFDEAVESFIIGDVSFNYGSGIDQRVPEPTTFLLVGSGLLGLALFKRMISRKR